MLQKNTAALFIIITILIMFLLPVSATAVEPDPQNAQEENSSDKSLTEFVSLYTDANPGEWYYTYMETLTDLNILNGFTDGTVRPYEAMTLAEYLKTIVCAAGIPTTAVHDTQKFPESHWASPYFEAAYNAGIIEEGEYPQAVWNELVQRQVAASLTARMASVLAQMKEGILPDGTMNIDVPSLAYNGIPADIPDFEKVDDKYADEVIWVYYKRIMTGFPDKTFRPEQIVKRGEGCVMLYKIMEMNDLFPKDEPEPSGLKVPIIIYHRVADAPKMAVNPEVLRQNIADLLADGYTPVFYDEVYNFAKGTGSLPAKPVILSFDDGYLDNYETMFPILKEFNVKAEISIIGATVGWPLKDGDEGLPHFSWEQAKEMMDSGLVRIQSHSYDLHKEPYGPLRLPFQSDSDYAAYFKKDFLTLRELIWEHLSYDNIVYNYPYGMYDETSEALLKEEGYKITLTADYGMNYIQQKDTSSLYLMKRIPGDGNRNNILFLIDYYTKNPIVMNPVQIK